MSIVGNAVGFGWLVDLDYAVVWNVHIDGGIVLDIVDVRDESANMFSLGSISIASWTYR